MKHKTESPSLIREVGAIAGLYKDVFWMFGQRVQHGREWQQRLSDDRLAPQAPDRAKKEHEPAHQL